MYKEGLQNNRTSSLRKDIKVPKGKTFLVLSSIPLLKSNACATEICDFLTKRTGSEVLAGEVYVMLSRLKAQNLIVAEDESQNIAAQRGSRRRRIYSLTEEGRLAVQAGRRLYDANYKVDIKWHPATSCILPNGGSA